MILLLKSAFTKKNIIKFLGFFLFLLIFAYLQRRYSSITPEIFKDFILSFGIYGPLFFFIFSIFRPFFFFPITVLYLSSGLAFGAFWGGCIAITGALISSFTAYLIANKVGVDFLPMKWRSRICAVRDRVNKNGLMNMILVRFIPMISFDLISFSAGLSKVKLGTYLLGTFIGISPRVFAYTYLGANIISPTDPKFLIAMGVLFLIFIVPAGVYKLINKKKSK